MKHAALFLCLMASIAMADEKQDFLDSLQIPENLGPLGREGLAKFYGRPLVVEGGDWQGVFHFEAGGRVDWTRPNGKTLHGHFGDSAFTDRMCLDFGIDHNDCFYMQQRDNQLNFQWEDGGETFVGHADVGEADAAVPKRDAQICDAVETILDAGANDKLVDLTDPSKDEIRINDFSDPSFWTTVKVGNDYCRYSDGIPRPSVDCDFFFEDDAPEAEMLYEALVGQVRVCIVDRIKKAEIDTQVWLKYAEIDFAKMSTRKISKANYNPSKSDVVRSSNFKFARNMEARISLGYRSICKDILDCKFYYGVWTGFSRSF